MLGAGLALQVHPNFLASTSGSLVNAAGETQKHSLQQQMHLL
jgi:hypothetical protein